MLSSSLSCGSSDGIVGRTDEWLREADRAATDAEEELREELLLDTRFFLLFDLRLLRPRLDFEDLRCFLLLRLLCRFEDDFLRRGLRDGDALRDDAEDEDDDTDLASLLELDEFTSSSKEGSEITCSSRGVR